MKVFTGSQPVSSIQLIDETPVIKQPSIVGFAATPGTINPGQQVTLSGTVMDAVSITLNGVTIPGLPQIVVPTVSKTYTLVAIGAPGTTPATASLDVTVNAVPSNVIVGAITKTDQNAPKATPAGQTLVLALHGSGGPQLTFGDQWSATVDEPYADHSMPMTWAAQGMANGIYLQPHDKYWRTPTAFFESYWIGCAVGNDLRLYTEKRLDELMRQVTAQYPGASATKRVAAGGSMGAWGCMSYALRRPAMFAAVFASRPRWQWAGKAVTTSTGGVVYVDTLTTNGAPAAQHLDAIAYVSNPANAAPFAVWCVGRRDGYSAFADHVAAVQAMRATGRGFAFAWNDGDHSAGDILGSLGYLYNQFELGVGYPVLTNCSHDKDPAVDLVGTINAGFSWRNVVETPTAWSCEITNTQATTVTVRPKSSIFTASVTPKIITIAAGLFAAVSFAAAATNPVAPAISRYQIGVQGQALNLVCLARQYAGGDAYERFQLHTCLTTTTTSLIVKSMTNGGPRTFAFGRYAIFLSPNQDMTGAVIRAVGNVTGSQVTFALTLGAEADGPYFARVLPVSAADVPLTVNLAENYPVYGLWVDRNGTAKDHPKAIKQNGSFIWAHPETVGGPVYSDVVLVDKASLVALPLPLPERKTVTPFAMALPAAQVARAPVVACPDNSDSDTHYPCITTRGITVTENVQGYTPQRMFDALPVVPLLDGPRGVCTAPYSTVLQPGRDGKVYVCSPWSLAVFDSAGTKRTLFGLRHRAGMVPYHETPADSTTHPSLEIVGDFDPTTPMAERYPLESWFLLWDSRSLLLDNAALPIGGEQPHLPYTLPSGEVVNGPRAFLADRRGWVWELRFNGINRAAPAKVRKWITGLNDPWGGANMPTQNTFALAQRTAHSIDEWSMNVPNTKVRNILSSAGTGSLQTFGASGNRRWSANLAAARTLPICAPESIRIRNGRLTVGALAQEQVRAFDLATGALVGVVATPTVNYGGVGSYFVDHDISDGTCGPADTVFTVTFFNSAPAGHFQAFLPGGAGWSYMQYTYGVDRGRGASNGGHYPTSVGCANGRIYTANSAGGIDYWCKADAYDPQLDVAKAYRGYLDYRAAGLSLLHGPYAVNRNAYQVAKGINADRDYWYAMLGV